MDGQTYAEGEIIEVVADASYSSGDIIQVRDGRAGVIRGNYISGDTMSVEVTRGLILTCPKTLTMVLLDGGSGYWDFSANKVHFAHGGDRDFFLGSIVGDCASAATTCKVALNVHPEYAVSLEHGWNTIPVLTADIINGAVGVGKEGVCHTFGAVAEAGKNDALSMRSFSNASLAIVEARITVVDGGDNAALDYNLGLADATHATDADSIAVSAFMHLNGTDVNIYFESDDGTTEVAATDSTVNYAAGTAFEVWWDLRDIADIQIYVDGVNVLPSSVFKLNAAAAATLKLLSHMEKTSDNTTADIVVHFLRARLAQI